jgi:hypothetical protein
VNAVNDIDLVHGSVELTVQMGDKGMWEHTRLQHSVRFKDRLHTRSELHIYADRSAFLYVVIVKVSVCAETKIGSHVTVPGASAPRRLPFPTEPQISFSVHASPLCAHLGDACSFTFLAHCKGHECATLVFAFLPFNRSGWRELQCRIYTINPSRLQAANHERAQRTTARY